MAMREEYRLYLPDFAPGERRILEKLRLWVLRDPVGNYLHLVPFAEEEHLEGPAPEPLQEEPLQGQDREAPAADGGVGAPGPLPDADAEQGEVVEGVAGLSENQPTCDWCRKLITDDRVVAFPGGVTHVGDCANAFSARQGYDAGLDLGRKFAGPAPDIGEAETSGRMATFAHLATIESGFGSYSVWVCENAVREIGRLLREDGEGRGYVAPEDLRALASNLEFAAVWLEGKRPVPPAV